MSLAAFDLDGTLTVRDCVRPFLQTIAGRGFVPRTVVRRAPALTSALLRRDRDSAKMLVIEDCFRGRDADTVTRRGEDYAHLIASKWLRRDTLARLRWHQEQGHRVLLVSASLDAYVHPLGRLLGVDDVLCTTLEVVDGVYTGKLVGENCRGVEKVRRLESWAESNGVSPGEWLSHAYGDSRGDLAMLNHASNGFFVRKKELSVTC